MDFDKEIEAFIDLPYEEQEKIENEFNKMIKNAKKKKADDAEFDDLYNLAIKNVLFEADLESPAVFIMIEDELNTLYMYYQYTRRFINKHESKAREYYTLKAEEAKDSIYAYDYADELLNNGTLTNLHFETTLITLYRLFEKFLKSYLDLLDDQDFIQQVSNTGDSIVPKYMSYLSVKHHVFVPVDLYMEYDLMRLVRNHLVHSNSDIDGKLKKRLKTDNYEIYDGKEIVININYLENSFKNIGKIVKCIEQHYLKFH